MSPVMYSTTGEACAYVDVTYTTTELCHLTERDRSVRGGQRTVRHRDHTVSAAIGALTIDTVAVGRTFGSTKNSGKPGTQWTAHVHNSHFSDHKSLGDHAAGYDGSPTRIHLSVAIVFTVAIYVGFCCIGGMVFTRYAVSHVWTRFQAQFPISPTSDAGSQTHRYRARESGREGWGR